MAAPQEIVAAPLAIYLAPVGTAFPLVDATPAVTWELLGTSGTKNYGDEGVTVTHGQSVEEWRPAGGTGARKAFRTEESLVIEAVLVDLDAAHYAKVLDDATVTHTNPSSGVPGTDEFSTQRGLDVQEFALLARGVSPADNTLAAQYEVPRVYQAGEPAPVYVKGTPAGLAVSFAALEDDSAGFGTLVIQTDAAS
jgi:hypothetical protein